MSVKRALVWVVGGLALLYLLLLLLMTPVRTTSGSGEGNVMTTKSP